MSSQGEFARLKFRFASLMHEAGMFCTLYDTRLRVCGRATMYSGVAACGFNRTMMQTTF